MKNITIKELRPGLPKIVKEIDETYEHVVVTKYGNPVIVMLSVDDYESMLETINILSDKSGLQRIKKSIAEIKSGDTIPLSKLREKLENV